MTLTIHNFLPDAACDLLVNTWRRNQDRLMDDGNPFYKGRVLWLSVIPHEQKEARQLAEEVRLSVGRVVAEEFKAPLQICDDGPQVVRWPEGTSLPPHKDDRHPDGRPHETWWRVFSTVIYLNNDYGGGGLMLPDRGETHYPAKGTLIAFRSSELHGVERVTWGERFTMPMWFSYEQAYWQGPLV